MSVNKVILVGNVGKDPETSHLDGGLTVSKFSLATSESYTSKTGEKVTNTEWHNIVAWRGLAEVIEKYVKKGMQLYIEGKLQTRSWEKEGQKHYATEIVAESLQMLGKKETSESNQPKEEQLPSFESKGFNNPDDPANDLPFA